MRVYYIHLTLDRGATYDDCLLLQRVIVCVCFLWKIMRIMLLYIYIQCVYIYTHTCPYDSIRMNANQVKCYLAATLVGLLVGSWWLAGWDDPHRGKTTERSIESIHLCYNNIIKYSLIYAYTYIYILYLCLLK